MRWVTLRIGFVVGLEDGALPFLAKLTKWGLGGSISNGRQWISWLHEEDMDAIFLRAIDDEAMCGVYHATGPKPVTNAELMRELRGVLGRPWSPPVPKPAVYLGGWLVGSDPVIGLTGRRCIPKKLSEEDFKFRHPQLREALRVIYRKEMKS
jgi:NAD dependent epimerase/dehydratase family enzyme